MQTTMNITPLIPANLQAAPAPVPAKKDRRQWLRLPQVLAKTQTGKSWLYGKMKDKADPFPAGLKLSARCIVWDESLVEAWMSRQAEKLAQPAADLVDMAQAADA